MADGTPCLGHDNIVKLAQEALSSAASAHHRVDAVEKRIDDLEDLTKSVISLSHSVESLTKSIEIGVMPKLDNLEGRVISVEHRPGETALKYWRLILVTLITATITGAIGILIGLLMKSPETVEQVAMLL